MLIFRTKLFDGFLRGTGNVYTQTADAELLGAVERISLGVVFTGVAGTSPTFTLQFENSPDGTRWVNQNATPELNAVSITPASGDTRFEIATNMSSTAVPIANYIRLRFTLGGTSPSGYLRLWAVGRSPAL